MGDIVGWVASFILVATIGAQIHKQWKAHDAKGVSQWLYVGQMVASVGFVIYSVTLESWTFVVTNSVMFCSAALGMALSLVRKRQQRDEPLPEEATGIH